MRSPRRLVRLVLAACVLLLGLAGAASAHPLGNFTINHVSDVKISEDAVAVHYILDQAEIPTFQERRLTDEQSITRKTATTVAGLALTVDGRQVALAPVGPGRLSKPMGQGGLRTTRFELDLRAPVSAPRRVALDDKTYSDRIGWRGIVIQPGNGTDVRTTEAYSRDATNGLRQYPVALLQTPLDQRAASFSVAPGNGSVSAPRGPDGPTRKVDGSRGSGDARSGGDGFAAVFADAASGKGVLVLLLLAAFAWGAFHALSPGHGKVMVAAYLVGTKGTPRDAVALGAIVTVTHTIGVFALGLITLALSQYVLPETLYPYLNLTAGLLVVAVGIGALRDRLRARRAGTATGHAHDDSEAHAHDHGDSHDHDHAHDHGHSHAHDHDQAHDHDRGHAHGHAHAPAAAAMHSHGGGRAHSHAPPDELTARGLLGMGAAAGLIPCPSALVVLLGAIAQHQILLGLLLITVFSLGLAGTLTALGLVVVHSKARLPAGRGGRFVAALPAVSALVILVVGCVLTLQAIPKLN